MIFGITKLYNDNQLSLSCSTRSFTKYFHFIISLKRWKRKKAGRKKGRALGKYFPFLQRLRNRGSEKLPEVAKPVSSRAIWSKGLLISSPMLALFYYYDVLEAIGSLNINSLAIYLLLTTCHIVALLDKEKHNQTLQFSCWYFKFLQHWVLIT